MEMGISRKHDVLDILIRRLKLSFKQLCHTTESYWETAEENSTVSPASSIAM